MDTMPTTSDSLNNSINLACRMKNEECLPVYTLYVGDLLLKRIQILQQRD